MLDGFGKTGERGAADLEQVQCRPATYIDVFVVEEPDQADEALVLC